MSRVNSVLVVHTVGIPSLSTVLNLYDLDAVTLSKSGGNHILAGSAGILAHLILSVGFPAAEGTYEVDTVIAYGSRSGSGFGSGRSCGLGSRIYAADIIESDIIVTGAVLFGHVNAGSAGKGDIDRLLGAIVDDVVSHALGHLEGVALLAHLVRVIVSHRNAGPFYRLIFLRPVVNVNSAEALVVGEDDGAALFGIRLCGLLIRSSRDNDRSRSGRLYRLYGLFLADIILDAHLSDITLDQSSVDNSDEAVAVYISRELLLLGQGCVINRSAHNNNRVSAVNCTVAANITEDIGLGRIGRSRRIGGLGSFVVLIENSNAGGTDRTLDLALGYGKGVAGDSILIGARCQFMIGQSDVLRGGAAEVDDHRAGITSLDVSSTAVVSGAVLGLTDEVVMELVDRLGGSVRPRGLARFT